MKVLCPTCRGRGSIPDPECAGAMSYNGPNGEICPYIVCLSCGGSGWVEESPAAISKK